MTPSLDPDRSAWPRWIVCLALVIALHGLAFFALRQVPPDIAAASAGNPDTVFELEEPAAPPAPPSDLAVGPDQAASEEQVAQQPTPPPPKDDPPPPKEDPKPPDVQPPQPSVPDQPAPPMETPPPPEEPKPSPPPPQPVPDVPPPPPQDVPAPAMAASDASVASAPPGSTAANDQPSGPKVEPAPDASAAAISTWQRGLVAHLERFKRFPKAATGHSGIVKVAFSIDRQGHLVDARVVATSGSPILDAEAIATLRRAEPFPKPPDSLGGPTVSFVLPIRYRTP